MSDWRKTYLAALGAKPTVAALEFLAQWQPYEGGHTNNNAQYNYFNTTQRMPGSSPINSVGVQSYRTLAQGAQAFARTLLGNPNYAGLVQALRSGQVTPQAVAPALSTWVSGDPASAHGLSYASKVLGSPVTAPGSSSGRTAGAEPAGGGSTPSPGMSVLDGAAQLRDQARSNLASEASGFTQPTDQLAKLAPLFHSLKQSIPQLPQLTDPSVVNDPLAHAAVKMASKYLGVKYTWGGTNASTGFDCSGLLQTVWGQLGVKIPRTTFDQWKAGNPVSGPLKAGDAVFFKGSDSVGGLPGHVGMYIGNGKMIVAPHTGTNVQIQSLSGHSDYMGARRF